MDKQPPRSSFSLPRSAPDVDLLAAKAEELRVEIRTRQPELLAAVTGTSWFNNEFQFDFWGQSVCLTFPELRLFNCGNVTEMPSFHQTMALYYFATCDGADLTGDWISFADLPGGRIYNQAFQGYTGNELVKVFDLDVEAFKSACEKSGGVATLLGDAAYIFYALPRLPMAVNYWCGDEDFPSSCKILFDSSASHYLPTDVIAILGSMLKGRIVKNAK